MLDWAPDSVADQPSAMVDEVARVLVVGMKPMTWHGTGIHYNYDTSFTSFSVEFLHEGIMWVIWAMATTLYLACLDIRNIV